MSAAAQVKQTYEAVTLRKAQQVQGHHLSFRNATPDDAHFILRLRSDATRAIHLSPVSASLEAQREWLQKYQLDDSQAYFIVVARNDSRPVGTVRLYDQKGTSFCWGSWMRTDDAPVSFALESTLMVYAYGRELGFHASHFDVRIANDRVWSFHERLGARRTRSTEKDHHYEMDRKSIDALLEAHKRRLPKGIQIDFC
jgi:RimJ/RimL family protein N-acetyltransferase